MKNSIKEFFLKYKHGIPLITYFLIYITWWSHLEETVTSHYQVIHMAIDDYIPFCEIFVIPYYMWFGYISITVLYFFLFDKHDYYRSLVFLFTGMTIFLIISTLWPNGHHLRLATMPRDNIFTHIIAFLWRNDTATNLWPSIHCYNSIGAYLAIKNSKRLEKYKWIRISSFVLSSLIIMSTVLIKQHSMFDVITAFIMAAVMYLLVYRYDLFTAVKRIRYHRLKIS